MTTYNRELIAQMLLGWTSFSLTAIAEQARLLHEADNRDAAGVKCTWTQDEPEADYWRTHCGGYFAFNEGMPTDNNFRFCCYCGKLVVEDSYQDDDEELPA